MPRSVSCLGYLLALWVAVAPISTAQETPRLRVQPDRLQRAKEAEQQAMRDKDTLGLAEAYYQYGRTYIFAGDYRASQRYLLKALQLLEPRGNSFELSRIYVRLSENEGRLQRFGDALRYANLSLTVARRVEPSKALGLAYGVLGRTYENIWAGQVPGDPAKQDSALLYYRREAAVYRDLNDTLGIAETNLELGTLLTKMEDSRAIPHLEKALQLIDLLRRDRAKVNVMLHLASAYLTFGKRELAFQTLREAEKIYANNRVDEYDTILGLEKEFVAYYQATGQWKEAFAHLEKRNELERGQLLSDRDGTIARLNVAYETEKKEALLRAQKSELALTAANLVAQQRFTVAASGLLLMAVGISLIFFRLYRKNQRISRQNGELVKEQNHRVKNNLQVVLSLLSLQSKRLTDETAKKAIDETRLRVQSMAILHQRLYDGDKLAAVNLNEFIPELIGGVLRAYGYPTLQPQFAIDDITLPADKAVPLGLILNELTTNACKYAFPHNQVPSLRIHCHRKNHLIELSVTDNGPGLEGPGRDDEPLEGPGRDDGPLEGEYASAVRAETFGMQLIRAQVKQLRGTHRFGPVGLGVGRGTRFTMTFNQ